MDANSLDVLFTSLPGRYAKALFVVGRRESCLDAIIDNFLKLETFFKNHPAVKKLLTSYCMNKKDLDTGWLALGNYLSFCPVFLNFMRQVVKNKRFDIIKKIKHIFDIAFAKHKNCRSLTVSSTVELLPEQKKKLEKLIAKAFKEKTIIKYKINEKILGGIKISSEELIVDASVRAQMDQLANFYKNLKLGNISYED